MAKKQTAKTATKPTKTAEEKAQGEHIVLNPNQEKAFTLVDKSAKVRGELERAVSGAMVKAVQECMKENKIDLTPTEADELVAIWFGECDE